MWGVDEDDVRGRQTPVAHAASMMEKQKAMDRWKRVCVDGWEASLLQKMDCDDSSASSAD